MSTPYETTPKVGLKISRGPKSGPEAHMEGR